MVKEIEEQISFYESLDVEELDSEEKELYKTITYWEELNTEL